MKKINDCNTCPPKLDIDTVSTLKTKIQGVSEPRNFADWPQPAQNHSEHSLLSKQAAHLLPMPYDLAKVNNMRICLELKCELISSLIWPSYFSKVGWGMQEQSGKWLGPQLSHLPNEKTGDIPCIS